MSVNLIKYAFVAGELSPTLFGRSDLEKYEFGLALCRNFFVDYKGGISTRAGTAFLDYLWRDDKGIKLFPFQFESDIADTYMMIFGHRYVRFMQNGAYVEEAPKVVSGVTKANPGQVTITAHGFSANNWVRLYLAGMAELNERIVSVRNVTTNTFDIHDEYGVAIDTTGFGSFTSGTAQRIHTVTTPYTSDDLEDLQVYQIRDTVRLTHSDFSIRNLTRNASDDWTLDREDFTAPEIIGTPGLEGQSVDLSAEPPRHGSVGAAVTWVDENGKESQRSRTGIVEDIRDYTSENGHLQIAWDRVEEADFYNIYRTRFTRVGDITGGEELGFIGQTRGTTLYDSNIVPDFAVTPPIHHNPFANGRISRINVTNSGSGYTHDATVSISDPNGTGFIGYPVVAIEDGPFGLSFGRIVGVEIISGGEGYTNPTVSFSGGSGAAGDAVLTPASGNYPSISTIFQQRQLYSSSVNDPMKIWGSRPGFFSNFDFSRILTAGDSYEFELDTEVVGPIHHMIPLRTGLLVLGETGIWNISGGQEVSVTSLNVVAEAQSYTGVAKVEPVLIDADVLYLERGGRLARLLRYNEIGKVYSGQNMSVLSNHFFQVNNQIKRWAFSRSPANLIWAVREDGTLLSFTIDIEQNVFAWAQHSTKGLVKDVQVVHEFGQDVVYMVVRRLVNGRWSQFVERFMPRGIEYVEEAWAVDCGVLKTRAKPVATLTPAAATGNNVLFTASASVFSAGDVGKIIRGGGCKAEIITFVNGTKVRADIIRPLIDVIPEDSNMTPLPIPSGQWTMAANGTSLGGLRHLEGETIQVLVDGKVDTPRVVTNGQISHTSGSFVTAGLGFQALAQTLPPTVSDVPIESRRKDVVGSAVRVYDTRGLKVGATLDSLYEMKDRTDEAVGEPTRLQRKNQFITLAANWDINGQTFYVQDYPLPATILGLVTEVDVGDDLR